MSRATRCWPTRTVWSFYRRMLERVKDYLVHGGVFLVEIAWDQGQAVLGMFERSGLADCRNHQGYGRARSGGDRTTRARYGVTREGCLRQSRS